MVFRSLRLAASLAVIPAGLAACRQEAAIPVAVQTVRLALVAGAEHGGAPLSTPMTQEVTSTPPYAGDPDGTGAALVTVNHGQREICWEVSVSDITLPATFSHIHKAAAGIRGPIVVGLSAPDATGRSVGCASGLDQALLRDILTNTASYYVNVHTTDYPPGAVRGQLGH